MHLFRSPFNRHPDPPRQCRHCTAELRGIEAGDDICPTCIERFARHAFQPREPRTTAATVEWPAGEQAAVATPPPSYIPERSSAEPPPGHICAEAALLRRELRHIEELLVEVRRQRDSYATQVAGHDEIQRELLAFVNYVLRVRGATPPSIVLPPPLWPYPMAKQDNGVSRHNGRS
jgi:hypothetical protein